MDNWADLLELMREGRGLLADAAASPERATDWAARRSARVRAYLGVVAGLLILLGALVVLPVFLLIFAANNRSVSPELLKTATLIGAMASVGLVFVLYPLLVLAKLFREMTKRFKLLSDALEWPIFLGLGLVLASMMFFVLVNALGLWEHPSALGNLISATALIAIASSIGWVRLPIWAFQASTWVIVVLLLLPIVQLKCPNANASIASLSLLKIGDLSARPDTGGGSSGPGRTAPGVPKPPPPEPQPDSFEGPEPDKPISPDPGPNSLPDTEPPLLVEGEDQKREKRYEEVTAFVQERDGRVVILGALEDETGQLESLHQTKRRLERLLVDTFDLALVPSDLYIEGDFQHWKNLRLTEVAAAITEAEVRRFEDAGTLEVSVEIRIETLDAHTGRSMWSETYESKEKDLMSAFSDSDELIVQDQLKAALERAGRDPKLREQFQ